MPPKIHTYALTNRNSTIPTVQSRALELLRPHLPTCLPLYRRIQSAHIFSNPCIVSNLPLDSNDNPGSKDDRPKGKEIWCMAFSDRSTRPDTELWFYGSWEDAQHEEKILTEKRDEIDALVYEVIVALKNLGVPTSIHQDMLDSQAAVERQQQTLGSSNSNNNDNESKDSGGFSRADYGGHANDPDILLCGAVHQRSVEVFSRLGVISTKYKKSLQPNFMFIWEVEDMTEAKAIPEGLRWGELAWENFELVRSRTQIPRRATTLAALPNLGIFPAEGGAGVESTTAPVAWTFVGVDGSLTTLHVETEWRGKGLAKAVTTRLFREKMRHLWEEGVTRWAHGYVIVGNKESEGMCRSLGGRSGWEVFWLRVDLGLV